MTIVEVYRRSTVYGDPTEYRRSIVNLTVFTWTANKKPRHFHSMGGFSRARKYSP
jgi:hypothetical protein